MIAVEFDFELFRRIADSVQQEYQMGGLSEGVYYVFARDCAMRYVAELVRRGIGINAKEIPGTLEMPGVRFVEDA